MKVYIAAPFPLRDEAIAVMHHLESLGHIITSRWLKGLDDLSDAGACMDLWDVADADLLLAINPAEWSDRGGGGRHVELGYAIALDKVIVLWGARSNIFHYLAGIRVIETLEEL